MKIQLQTLLKNKLTKIGLGILLCWVVAAVGGLATASSVGDWYVDLKKPFFTPPGWVFGPAWSLLYTLMGISMGLFWHKAAPKGLHKLGLSVFGIQLLLNCLWSVLFFGLRSPLLGMFDIIVLWIFILITILLFKRQHTLASYLLWPYLAWVTFASALNISIWWLN